MVQVLLAFAGCIVRRTADWERGDHLEAATLLRTPASSHTWLALSRRRIDAPGANNENLYHNRSLSMFA